MELIDGYRRDIVSYLDLEYSDDWFVASNFKGPPVCNFQDLYLCQKQPIYPTFIEDWYTMRKMGIPSHIRVDPHTILMLCRNCTLLQIGKRTEYTELLRDDLHCSYKHAVEVREALENERDKLIESWTATCFTYLDNHTRNVKTITLEIGKGIDGTQLVHVDLNKFREQGTITLVQYTKQG